MKEETPSGSNSSNGEEDEEEDTQQISVKKISIKVRWVTANDDDDDNNKDNKEQEVKDVTFKIEDNLALRWLMISYCDDIGADYGCTRFEFKGVVLRETDTPNQLSMVSSDVVDAFRFHDIYRRSGLTYTAVCIRMHNARDTFLRVRNSAPLLPQLMRGLSDGGPQEEGSLCFVYEGNRLSSNDRVDEMDIVDGDIIDAFNFQESCSSLSKLDPHRFLRLKFVRENHNHIFRLKCSIRLSTLVRKYCEAQSLPCGIALFYKGDMLKESQTVDEAGLEDGDELYVKLIGK